MATTTQEILTILRHSSPEVINLVTALVKRGEEQVRQLDAAREVVKAARRFSTLHSNFDTPMWHKKHRKEDVKDVVFWIYDFDDSCEKCLLELALSDCDGGKGVAPLPGAFLQVNSETEAHELWPGGEVNELYDSDLKPVQLPATLKPGIYFFFKRTP